MLEARFIAPLIYQYISSYVTSHMQPYVLRVRQTHITGILFLMGHLKLKVVQQYHVTMTAPIMHLIFQNAVLVQEVSVGVTPDQIQSFITFNNVNISYEYPQFVELPEIILQFHHHILAHQRFEERVEKLKGTVIFVCTSFLCKFCKLVHTDVTYMIQITMNE